MRYFRLKRNTGVPTKARPGEIALYADSDGALKTLDMDGDPVDVGGGEGGSQPEPQTVTFPIDALGVYNPVSITGTGVSLTAPPLYDAAIGNFVGYGDDGTIWSAALILVSEGQAYTCSPISIVGPGTASGSLLVLLTAGGDNISVVGTPGIVGGVGVAVGDAGFTPTTAFVVQNGAASVGALDCGGLPILQLPTVDPEIVGALWNDGGTPAISTGP
jgi:hypothetical protein